LRQLLVLALMVGVGLLFGWILTSAVSPGTNDSVLIVLALAGASALVGFAALTERAAPSVPKARAPLYGRLWDALTSRKYRGFVRALGIIATGTLTTVLGALIVKLLNLN
jgi:hypothetical protein